MVATVPAVASDQGATMDDRQITEALSTIQEALGQHAIPPPPPPPSGITARVEQATGLVDKIKDNIAYILGLPAAIGGSFGFLWDSGNEQAELAYQVSQLEEAVAGLKAEGDLLGGGTKNFSIDLSGAPGGSIVPILMGVALVAGLGLLFWYQARRRR